MEFPRTTKEFQMRITNSTNQTAGSPADGATPPTPRTDAATSALAGTHLSSSSVSAPASSLAPSFDLLRLNTLLQQIPPARPDAIAEILQRLTSGQLNTPDALDSTARAMLGI